MLHHSFAVISITGNLQVSLTEQTNKSDGWLLLLLLCDLWPLGLWAWSLSAMGRPRISPKGHHAEVLDRAPAAAEHLRCPPYFGWPGSWQISLVKGSQQVVSSRKISHSAELDRESFGAYGSKERRAQTERHAEAMCSS